MIYIIGPMACGKSTVGRALAERLGVGFADTDDIVTAAHGPIPEIFARGGEALFREYEIQAVAGADAGVVATGGGAVLREENRQVLRRGTVLYLSVSEATARVRLAGDADRPLLAEADAMARWTQLYAQRRQSYENLADVQLNVDDLDVDQIIERLLPHVIPATS